MLRAFRTYKPWSKKSSDGALLSLSLPHSTTEDDWYNGMFIPKGTLCLANLWQCHHDPASYGDDAASFRPGRFLDAHGNITSGPSETREEGHGTYGFGTRACVGKHVANESLFIYIATALWAVTLERARDQDGNEVPFDMEAFVDTGTVLYACQTHTLSSLGADLYFVGSQLHTSAR